MYSHNNPGFNTRIMKRNKGETDVLTIAGNYDTRNDYNPKGAAQESLEADNTYIGGGRSIGIDIYDDLYVINSNNDGSNLFKGGLFALGITEKEPTLLSGDLSTVRADVRSKSL